GRGNEKRSLLVDETQISSCERAECTVRSICWHCRDTGGSSSGCERLDRMCQAA
ncbi:hypothetical protein BaRGS_00028630, partial [Batillaria attramentaria]